MLHSEAVISFASVLGDFVNLHSQASDQAEMFASTSRRLSELFSAGESLERLLTEIVVSVESQCNGMLCSVLLVGADGKHFRVGAAPHLPAAYNALFQDVLISEGVGSCGTAAYRKQLVIVRDIEKDPLWANYKEYAQPHGLRACWSAPILSGNEVLGTFACYYREPRSPEPDELQMIDSAARLAVKAIQYFRAPSLPETARPKTVLLVEDNEDFRELVRHFLTKDGFQVLEAANSEAALVIWKTESHRISLVITDDEMPGMRGRDLAAALLGMRPEIKVLLMSGTLQASSESQWMFLPKPFSRSDLQQKIKLVLD